MKNLPISLLALGLLAPFTTQAQTAVQTQTGEGPTVTMQATEQPKKAAPSQPKIFYGGGIGFGFGDVEYLEIWPLVGVNLTRQLGVGVQLLYRSRKDKRFQESLTTDDYGATLFARYKLPGPLYLQAEYEYLDYEYRTSYISTETKRDSFSSFMAGGGVSQAVGGNASIYATVLYNFSYDQADSPYDNPWIVRFGVGVGF
ncbi:MAG: hypothetical protein PVF82_18030 [Gammaproteobacteria bacterium]|jgi:hypothetical protein